MRLIDADRLKRVLIAFFTGAHSELSHISKVIDFLDTAPTIDAVEVVRCKDCKYHIDDRCYASSLSNLAKYSHIKLGILTGGAYFCADGERKKDE